MARNATGRPAKFTRATKTIERALKAARVQLEARRKLDEQIAKDRAELERRDKRRAFLAGSWVLAHARDWFDDPLRRRDFDAWLAEVPTRADDAFLFAEGSDDDCLTEAKIAELAADLGEGAEVDIVLPGARKATAAEPGGDTSDPGLAAAPAGGGPVAVEPAGAGGSEATGSEPARPESGGPAVLGAGVHSPGARTDAGADAAARRPA